MSARKLAGVTSDAVAERIRELALSLPESYEDEPCGHPVFKVADNRMFASMSVAPPAVRLTVKLTAEITDDESLAAALEWRRESYWLKAPAELRDAAFS